jgi:hypothetical protein
MNKNEEKREKTSKIKEKEKNQQLKNENRKSYNRMDKKSSNSRVYESKYLSLGRPIPHLFLQPLGGHTWTRAPLP